MTRTAKQQAILDDLHPLLRARVESMLDELGGRFVPICGYRSPADQLKAYRRGRDVVVADDGITVVSARKTGPTVTNAAPGQSPHNYRPALAVDLVLDVDVVAVGPHPDDARVRNAWEMRPAYPEAVRAWRDLATACVQAGLVHGGSWRIRDWPHVELASWREYLVK